MSADANSLIKATAFRSAAVLLLVSGCATTEQRNVLFPDTLALTTAPGDSIIANCRSEFSEDTPYSDAIYESMACVQPAAGLTNASLSYYQLALSEYDGNVLLNNPQSGISFSACIEGGAAQVMVISTRLWDLVSSRAAAQWSDPPQPIMSEEDFQRLRDEVSNSLPIAIYYNPEESCART